MTENEQLEPNAGDAGHAPHVGAQSPADRLRAPGDGTGWYEAVGKEPEPHPRAEDIALQQATAAATARPNSGPEPAARAAHARAAKIPAPIIEPSPTTASPTPRVRRSSEPAGLMGRPLLIGATTERVRNVLPVKRT